MGKKYIVGPKASFVSGGRVYRPGDEIDGDVFNDKAREAALKGGQLLEKGKDPGPGNSGGSSGLKSIDEMTLEELRAYAAEKKIAVSGNKPDILAAIKKAQTEPGEFDALSDMELMALAAEKGIDPTLGREAILAELKNKSGN